MVQITQPRLISPTNSLSPSPTLSTRTSLGHRKSRRTQRAGAERAMHFASADRSQSTGCRGTASWHPCMRRWHRPGASGPWPPCQCACSQENLPRDSTATAPCESTTRCGAWPRTSGAWRTCACTLTVQRRRCTLETLFVPRRCYMQMGARFVTGQIAVAVARQLCAWPHSRHRTRRQFLCRPPGQSEGGCPRVMQSVHLCSRP